MAKIQPAAVKLYFQMPALMTSGTIDISECVSQVNRRFYRQGLNWAVQNLKLFSNTGVAVTFVIATAQDSWVVSNSWHKGFANWKKMQREFGTEGMPSILPKYNDFKVFLDANHYDTVTANIDGGGTGQQVDTNAVNGTLVPFNGMSSTPYLPGEWIYSKFVVPDVTGATTTDYFITIHGNNTATSVGLVKNYQQSRSVPQSPDPDTGGATPANVYSQMFDQGTVQTDAVVADMLDDNDELPYDQNDYPGGHTNAAAPQPVAVDGFSATNNSGHIQKFNTGPFNAQCGLIRVLLAGEPTTMNLELTLVQGQHRGYLVQPMQDV